MVKAGTDSDSNRMRSAACGNRLNPWCLRERPARFSNCGWIVGRNIDDGRGVWGNEDVQCEPIPMSLPMGLDQATDAVVGHSGPCEFPVWVGLNDEVFIGRAVVPDPADIFHHPLVHGPEGVMGEGIHPGILEPFFRSPAVPTFPDGRGTMFDGEAPGRIGVVVDQSISNVVSADLSQDEHEVFGADEPGGEMPVSGADPFDEMLGSLLEAFALNQVEGNGKDVSCLAVAFDTAVLVYIGPVEGGADSVVEIPVFSSFVRAT